MVGGMTQAPVPVLAFSVVVVGQVSGQPAGGAENPAAVTAGISAGGAMNDTLALPELRTVPVEVVAETVRLIVPPYRDNWTPFTGIPSRAPAATLRSVFGFQVA